MTRYYIDLKEYAETADISEVSDETLKEVIKDFLLEAQNRALTMPAVKLVCDNHHADLEHFMNYSESICKTCKQKI